MGRDKQMIKKKVTVHLTKEETDSPEPIEIKICVTDGEDTIEYMINFPKTKEEA